MSTDPPGPGRDPGAVSGRDPAAGGRGRLPARRESTETKAAYKTTELIAYVATVVGVLIAGLIVDNDTGGDLAARQVCCT